MQAVPAGAQSAQGQAPPAPPQASDTVQLPAVTVTTASPVAKP
jgi:hypothetical protein